MKSLTIFALTLAAAGAVFADDITIDTSPQMTPSGITRAQVKAELLQARADGSVAQWTTEADTSVRTEQAATRFAGSPRGAPADTALSGEDSGSFYFSQQRQPHNASAVLAGASRLVR